MPILRILKKVLWEFFSDACPSQAAALSYYTVFSLPPLLLIVVRIAGSVLGNSTVQSNVEAQIAGMAGEQAAHQVEVILASVEGADADRGLVTLLGGLALLFGSTTAFAQLQSSLNQAWNVKPDPNRGEIQRFFVKRLVSFGMILCLAFLILVSLLLSAALEVFSDVIRQYLPMGISAGLLATSNLTLSIVVFSAVFAVIHRYLPDAEIRWADALAGGVVTAILFSGGKVAISYYLARSAVTTVFGAAGSLAIILLWTYYTSIILLLGAEFTQVWSQRKGRHIQASKGAVRVKRQDVPA